LASSTLIPPQFQGQQGFANCLVALEIANRMGISVRSWRCSTCM
jgi:hypothetical protein